VSAISTKSRLSRNAVANLAWIGYGALVSFLLSPFVVRMLGADGFGVWSLAAGLLGYLGLLDIGIRQAVNRYVAKFHAVADHEECSARVSIALTLFLALSVVAVILAGALSLATPALFNIPPQFKTEAQIIVMLGGVTVAMSLIVGVYGGIISGLQRFDAQAVLEITTATLRAVGTVAVLSKGYGLIGLSLVNAGASIVNLLIYRIAARRLYPQVRPRLVPLAGERTRKMLAFSANSFAIVVLGMLIYNSDNIVIAALLPVESIAYYAIAANLIFQATTLTTAFSYLLTPRVSALSSRGEANMADQIALVGKYAMLMILPVVLSFLFRGETFIALWMSPDIARESGIILTLLAFLLWQNSGRSIIISTLTGVGEHHKLVPVFLLEAVANIVLSISLIGPLGIVGAAIGTLVPNAIASILIIPGYLKRRIGLRRADYYWTTMILPTLASLPFAAATFAMERLTTPGGLITFFTQVAVLLPLIPLAAWFTCLGEREKSRFAAGFRSVLKRT